MDKTSTLDCWFLTGATASGKTAIGIELAHRIDAEIVSLDSMAVYRGMDIGTAKPTAAQRANVPHHLIDIVEPHEDFSVFRYVEAVQAKIVEIRGRGREVLFVGGTPLYLKSLLRGLLDCPDADWKFRNQVEQELQAAGPQALHDRLTQVDPLTAARLHPHDTRRMIRALEVYKLTGRPISHLQMQFDESHSVEDCRVFVIQWPKEVLQERIIKRVETMFEAGLIDEVRRLTSGDRRLGRTASQAVGYREMLDHLSGCFDLDETIERVKTRTRRFAKRQGTWFRSLSECHWVPWDAETSADQRAEYIIKIGMARRQ